MLIIFDSDHRMTINKAQRNRRTVSMHFLQLFALGFVDRYGKLHGGLRVKAPRVLRAHVCTRAKDCTSGIVRERNTNPTKPIRTAETCKL